MTLLTSWKKMQNSFTGWINITLFWHNTHETTFSFDWTFDKIFMLTTFVPSFTCLTLRTDLFHETTNVYSIISFPFILWIIFLNKNLTNLFFYNKLFILCRIDQNIDGWDPYEINISIMIAEQDSLICLEIDFHRTRCWNQDL